MTYLENGDVITLTLAGGAGHGDPGLRDQRVVLDEVHNGYTSVEQAEQAYSLQFDKDGLEIKD